MILDPNLLAQLPALAVESHRIRHGKLIKDAIFDLDIAQAINIGT
jgi:hypothetical protein